MVVLEAEVQHLCECCLVEEEGETMLVVVCLEAYTLAEY